MTENFDNINLRDYIWEEEVHKFEPKENRHAQVLKGKRKEAEERENLKKKKETLSDLNSEDYKKIKADADHSDQLRELSSAE
jgi:hypothetical protein